MGQNRPPCSRKRPPRHPIPYHAQPDPCRLRNRTRTHTMSMYKARAPERCPPRAHRANAKTNHPGSASNVLPDAACRRRTCKAKRPSRPAPAPREKRTHVRPRGGRNRPRGRGRPSHEVGGRPDAARPPARPAAAAAAVEHVESSTSGLHTHSGGDTMIGQKTRVPGRRCVCGELGSVLWALGAGECVHAGAS